MLLRIAMDLAEQLQQPVFRALFEQTRDAVMLASASAIRILEANPRACDLLGFSLAELRSRDFDTICPEAARAIIRQFIHDALRADVPRTLTTRLRARGGGAIPCDLSLQPLEVAGEGLLLFTFQDISERIRAMEDIELRNVAIANVTSGVTIADARQPDLPLIYVNQGFQNITGYSAREAVGRSCRFLQGDDRDQPALDELRAALREGRPCVVRLRNYRKDGTLFHNELHISPVHNEDGELTHFVGIQLDVTEQVRARESLERSEAQIRQALEQERELNLIKSRFISMVSHEFRTPMTGIQASAALVRKFGDRLDRDKQARHLENIETSLKRMNRLLDDVLFFSRAEADKVRVNRAPVRIGEYFHRLIEELAPIHPGRQISFRNEIDGDAPLPLDTHLLDHIFQNLIGNAIKYSAPEEAVAVAASEDDAAVRIAVSDRGIGIPDADQARLFEAFHRAGNVGARQGTGLGLNIALRAVELLGGQLTFQSRQNEGSTFLVRLPKQPPEPATPAST